MYYTGGKRKRRAVLMVEMDAILRMILAIRVLHKPLQNANLFLLVKMILL